MKAAALTEQPLLVVTIDDIAKVSAAGLFDEVWPILGKIVRVRSRGHAPLTPLEARLERAAEF